MQFNIGDICLVTKLSNINFNRKVQVTEVREGELVIIGFECLLATASEETSGRVTIPKSWVTNLREDSEETPDNVVSLSTWKRSDSQLVKPKSSDFNFDGLMKANRDKKKRIAKDQKKENKSVIRSYRLKK